MKVMIRIVFALALSLTLRGAAPLASGSGEKSPEEKAAETRRNALKEYNAGVAHMKRANLQGAKSDSLYAFNYRATQDAKANRDFEKAIERFQAALALDVSLYEAHSNLGYCKRKTGLFAEALAAYAHALKIKPDFAPALEYRAEAYLGLDSVMLAQAAVVQLRSLAHGPDSAKCAAYADTLSHAIEQYQLARFSGGSTTSDHLPIKK